MVSYTLIFLYLLDIFVLSFIHSISQLHIPVYYVLVIEHLVVMLIRIYTIMCNSSSDSYNRTWQTARTAFIFVLGVPSRSSRFGHLTLPIRQQLYLLYMLFRRSFVLVIRRCCNFKAEIYVVIETYWRKWEFLGTRQFTARRGMPFLLYFQFKLTFSDLSVQLHWLAIEDKNWVRRENAQNSARRGWKYRKYRKKERKQTKFRLSKILSNYKLV